MITLGKKGNLAAYRRAMGFITKEDVVSKLFKEVAPKYADRNGGYTRVTRLGPRRRMDSGHRAGVIPPGPLPSISPFRHSPERGFSEMQEVTYVQLSNQENAGRYRLVYP